jgi:hypothetical protein
MAPRSRSNYTAGYHLGALKTAEGDIISVGGISYGTGGHAGLSLSAEEAKSHYDDTTTLVAQGRATDGRYGIWFSGSLEPDVDEVTLRKFRGSKLSGDWRGRGAASEMIHVLAVNAPGFQIPRALVASGVVRSLVAAGVVQDVDVAPPNAETRMSEYITFMLEREARAEREKMRSNSAGKLAERANTLRARIHARR